MDNSNNNYFCRYCGNKLEPTSVFCNKCGHKLEQATTNNTINNDTVNNDGDVASDNNNDIVNNDVINNIIKRKSSKKIIFIVIGIILLLIIFIIFKPFEKLFNKHTNTTGLSNYSSSDVDVNCTASSEGEITSSSLYADILINHNGNQAVVYSKTIITANNGVLSDDDYCVVLKGLNLINDNCTYGLHKISENHIEEGFTSMGMNTIIDRKNDKVEITANRIFGAGQTASKSDKKQIISDFEKQGFTCK